MVCDAAGAFAQVKRLLTEVYDTGGDSTTITAAHELKRQPSKNGDDMGVIHKTVRIPRPILPLASCHCG